MLGTLEPEQLSLAERFSYLSEEEQIRYLHEQFDKKALKTLERNWAFWGRPEQQLPKHDDWDILLCLAGRGSGKTRLAAEAVHQAAENKGWHIAIVGETAAEVRDVMVGGPSGLKATQKPWNPIEYTPTQRHIQWLGTGSSATTYSGDHPDQLRGPNSNFAWVDELAKFRYPELMFENLDMVLRAGEHPHCIISTTPRPIPLIKDFVKRAKDDPYIIIRRWNTYRNLPNLSPRYIERMLLRYEGTRLGRQELHAEILEDTEGALWTLRLIDSTRVDYIPYMSHVCVGVDPPASVKTECGITVLGLRGEHIYALDDVSLAGQPEEWGKAVVKAYHDWEADMVVPEKNQGGDMVSSTIRAIDPTVPLSPVWASRGKRARAEPIATYMEKGNIHHVGTLYELEDQLATWVPGDDDSPDRLDAYVYAATWLMQFTPYGMASKRAGAF